MTEDHVETPGERPSIAPFDKFKRSVRGWLQPPKGFGRLNSIRNIELLRETRGHLLDCGCGRGSNVSDLEEYLPGQHQIVGIDIFAADLRECRNRVSDKVELLQCNAMSLPFDARSFDVVLSNQVIEHIAEYDRYLDEIARVLKPNGSFVVSTPNFHCPRNTTLKMLGQKPVLRWSNVDNLPPEEFRGHTQEFTELELIDVVEKHGFALTKSVPIIPAPTAGGNLLFNVYKLLESMIYWCTRPFVARGYSVNSNMIFARR